MVAIERTGVWQFGVGCGIDSLQLHGRSGAGKRDRCIIENSPVATALFVRCAGDPRRIFRLHNCFWFAAARQFVASAVADALGTSANAAWTSFCSLVPHPARADNSDGLDPAVDNRGSSLAANQLWARDRLSVRLEHLRRSGRCTARGSVPHRTIWTSRDWIGCRFGGLRCRGDRVAGGETQRRQRRL